MTLVRGVPLRSLAGWAIAFGWVVAFNIGVAQTSRSQTSREVEVPLSRRIIAHYAAWGADSQAVIPVIVLRKGAERWFSAGRSARGGVDRAVDGSDVIWRAISIVGSDTTSITHFVTQRRLAITRHDTLAVPVDSTLIVMLDRVDGVGGAPSLRRLAVPLVKLRDVEDHPIPLDSANAYRERVMRTGIIESGLVRFLDTIRETRIFVRD